MAGSLMLTRTAPLRPASAMSSRTSHIKRHVLLPAFPLFAFFSFSLSSSRHVERYRSCRLARGLIDSHIFFAFWSPQIFVVMGVTESSGPSNLPASTQLETSMQSVHESLMKSIHYQTNFRMREAIHRKAAHYMNERVQYVSAAEAFLVVLASFLQVTYLKSLFNTTPNRV
eukprot:m.189671 g.189671  ORF g.189671 m.189671 type:complete len:171 (+) comp53615_c0_seq2:2-514(+)